MVNKYWKQIDDVTKKKLLEDREIHKFLKPVFIDQIERKKFIQKCLINIEPRRMLNHAHWYLEMADGQERVRTGRPALKIVFLMALAEYITKMRIHTNNISSMKAALVFFTYISKEDKEKFEKGFQRALLSHPHHNLRFSSILRILYEVRNQVVHGEDYYSFSLPSEEYKKKYIHYTHWGIITSGRLGKRGRKRRVSLDISITYEEIREIFRRTAIANIASLL